MMQEKKVVRTMMLKRPKWSPAQPGMMRPKMLLEGECQQTSGSLDGEVIGVYVYLAALRIAKR